MIHRANANRAHKLVRKMAGFTIVELLIVIVVIGILAAITVVSYNGIQNRAYVAKAASVADSYIKIMEMYHLDNDSYPFENSAPGYVACLGNSTDYPSSGDFAANECWASSNNAIDPTVVDSNLNNLLAPYVSSLPSGSLPPVRANSPDGWVAVRGIYYANDIPVAVDEPGVPGMVFVIKGNQDCPRGEKRYIEER